MDKEFSIQEELMAHAIGTAVIKYLRDDETIKKLLSELEPKATQVLEDIQKALDDDSLDDPTCFQHIEAIVDIFTENCIDTTRHDW